MSKAPKSINTAQLCRLYWPSWSAAKKVLISCNHTPEEAEQIRKDVLAKLGVESSKQLNNRQLDKVLSAHSIISNPKDGMRQAELADQALQRVRYRIHQVADQIGYDAQKIEGVSQQMFRRPFAHLTEAQLIKVSQALQTHVNRPTTLAPQPPHTTADPDNR